MQGLAGDIAANLADPRWHLDDIDADGGEFLFTKVARPALSEASFLDRRWQGRGEQVARPIGASTDWLAQKFEAPTPPRFIWHTAFCCSTLLARSIDVAGFNLSLKEPNAIEKLANIKRTQHWRAQDPGAWRKLFRATVDLYSRSFEPGEKVSLKPSNSANNLLLETLEQYPNTKALLLYSDLRSFLVSILKKKELGRHYARRMFAAFARDENFVRDIPRDDVVRLTDLQIAALGWLAEIAVFREAVSKFPSGQVLTLDAEKLLADPATVLLRLDEFFEIGLGAARIADIVAGPVFKNNAKDQALAFNVGQRANEARLVETAFGRDLDLIVNWAAKQWSHLKPLEQLPRSIATG